jgi:hypothetical protein
MTENKAQPEKLDLRSQDTGEARVITFEVSTNGRLLVGTPSTATQFESSRQTLTSPWKPETIGAVVRCLRTGMS